MPAAAKVDIGVGTYMAEVEPVRHFYGVSVSVPYVPHKRSYYVMLDPHDPRREIIYSIWVDPRDWTVEFFSDIRRSRPSP
jgi:hypothetical protein